MNAVTDNLFLIKADVTSVDQCPSWCNKYVTRDTEWAPAHHSCLANAWPQYGAYT